METNDVQTDNETQSLSSYGIKKDANYHPTVSKKENVIKVAAYIFLSALFYSVSFHYFVATCRFAPGGIGGIVAMVQFVIRKSDSTGIDYSPLIILILNLPVLTIAAKVLTREFAYRTLFTVILMTIIMFTMDNFIDPEYKFSITRTPLVEDVGTRLLSGLIGGVLCGMSLAFALKVNSSTGGADVVGAMLQKRNPHRSVASMTFSVNGVIMLISFFVYKDNFMPVFLSIIYIAVTSMICDRILQGSKNALKFEVVTEHAEEISAEIITSLGHGVTITPAEGMFEHKDKSLLICIIKPRQIAKFEGIISKYPETFAYVGQVNEIIGKFNSGASDVRKK